MNKRRGILLGVGLWSAINFYHVLISTQHGSWGSRNHLFRALHSPLLRYTTMRSRFRGEQFCEICIGMGCRIIMHWNYQFVGQRSADKMAFRARAGMPVCDPFCSVGSKLCSFCPYTTSAYTYISSLRGCSKAAYWEQIRLAAKASMYRYINFPCQVRLHQHIR